MSGTAHIYIHHSANHLCIITVLEVIVGKLSVFDLSQPDMESQQVQQRALTWELNAHKSHPIIFAKAFFFLSFNFI